ncbi:response regulator [Deinococcus peraridilitoris]|uniref:Response regulator containing CheY-like receiver and SARP domains n=1 Tax=Deinococcus peraridilitoris (strain DSM 19664 / LMG 22246 / CIP 109416 / KR-200) TaxID=937777 RepID=L0A3A8_DEIPD|nr:response regulator [Deinococcus peraridilitoris]AFZ67495.1 response regulator containing CheY-like receiver and SARP domains [Deinococcus peraridilitoris DSM 19664]
MPSVLVVDDDAAILKLVSVILARAGHEVHACAHPVEALSLLDRITPDLIISDVVMPHMTGYEFLEHVREREELSHLPFMLLSSHAERDDVRRGMNLGADDYLPKPFTPHDLTSAVDARLKRISSKPVTASGLEARGLGTSTVTWRGEPIPWVSRKAMELFFLLLEKREVTSWEAAEALWPEKDEARASSLFHTTLHRLRRSLTPEAVVSHSRRYALNPDLAPKYDARTFEERVERTVGGSPSLEEVRELIGQYGRYLPDVDSDWCSDVRRRIDEKQMSLLGLAAELARSAGRPREAASYHQQALMIDPFSDGDWQGLARALSDLGDPRARLAQQREPWWSTDLA